MSSNFLWTGILSGLIALISCGEDPSKNQDTQAVDVQSQNSFTKDPQDEEVTMTIANASDRESWIYFDFETGSFLETENPEENNTWDIAFRRVAIRLNANDDGQGGVKAARSEDSFTSLRNLASLSFATENPSGNPDKNLENLVFTREGGWYHYDPQSHTVTPKPLTWVVKTSAGYYKLQILSYYSESRESGHITFNWQSMEGP